MSKIIDETTADIISTALSAYPNADLLPINLNDLADITAKAHADTMGDTLATFIVRELGDITSGDPAPYESAANALERAAEELGAVAAALRKRAPLAIPEDLPVPTIEMTFAVIKPDATRRNLIGQILARAEAAGLSIYDLRRFTLSRYLAEKLYAVHAGKDFFGPQIDYMLSGPVVAVIPQGENAVQTWRDVMGPTDRKKAAPGTIRRDFALSVRENCVHGSDSLEAAHKEIRLFFDDPA